MFERLSFKSFACAQTQTLMTNRTETQHDRAITSSSAPLRLATPSLQNLSLISNRPSLLQCQPQDLKIMSQRRETERQKAAQISLEQHIKIDVFKRTARKLARTDGCFCSSQPERPQQHRTRHRDATLVPSDITKSDEQLISNATCTVYCKDNE